MSDERQHARIDPQAPVPYAGHGPEYVVDLSGSEDPALRSRWEDSRWEETALFVAANAAQLGPHVHLVDGVEVGHHRLFAKAEAGTTFEPTCGLALVHGSHPWVERSYSFRCPGLTSDQLTFLENQARSGTVEVEGRWVLLGRMDEARREDADTNAYTVMESTSPTDGGTVSVVVHSESDELRHDLVDALGGKFVRVTIEVIGQEVE